MGWGEVGWGGTEEVRKGELGGRAGKAGGGGRRAAHRCLQDVPGQVSSSSCPEDLHKPAWLSFPPHLDNPDVLPCPGVPFPLEAWLTARQAVLAVLTLW